MRPDILSAASLSPGVPNGPFQRHPPGRRCARGAAAGFRPGGVGSREPVVPARSRELRADRDAGVLVLGYPRHHSPRVRAPGQSHNAVGCPFELPRHAHLPTCPRLGIRVAQRLPILRGASPPSWHHRSTTAYAAAPGVHRDHICGRYNWRDRLSLRRRRRYPSFMSVPQPSGSSKCWQTNRPALTSEMMQRSTSAWGRWCPPLPAECRGDSELRSDRSHGAGPVRYWPATKVSTRVSAE
jgi:hypothetical protein